MRDSDPTGATDGLLPLSLEQSALLKQHKLRSWQFPLVFRLTESIDPDALSRALATVVARHEPLRLRLVGHDERGRQPPAPPAARFPVKVVTLRADRPAAQVIDELSRHPMDLYGHGPLRATVIRH